MTDLVIFNGTEQEASDLLAAAERYCYRCKVQGAGKCEMHEAMAADQQFVDRLIAYRRYAFELACQEMTL